MSSHRLVPTLAWLVLALASGGAGAALAWHHPICPIAAVVVLGIWCAISTWRPGVWLVVVPACLPFLNFSPWTGWIVFEEFDILLLGALTAGYGRLVLLSWSGGAPKIPGRMWGIMALLGSTGLVAMYRGFIDAGGFSFDWFAGYTDALNSLRVFKSLGFSLLFVPLLAQEMAHSRSLASQRLASGMVIGLAVVTLAALWERAAFPGLLDFSEPYRTVALFWEMHVGGAAIDGYLALSTPFVVWALIRARHPLVWAGAAAVALLAAYACLTTFSRGVYLAVVAPLALLAALLWAQTSGFDPRLVWPQAWRRYALTGWRARGDLFLVLALVAEVVAVMGGGSFMLERLSGTERDFGSRLAHWRHGLDLLESPADWLLGKGLGRLPEKYASHAGRGEFSGEVTLHREPGSQGGVNRFAVIRGPATLDTLGAQYALTQRVGQSLAGAHIVSLDMRVRNKADIYLELCERHLLYDGACQAAQLRVVPGPASWQTFSVPLTGPTLRRGAWYAPRLAMLSLSVANAGGVVDVDNVRLSDAHQAQLLENGDFSRGLARWFPAAQGYFLPWHIDNLFLELLVERGLIGLVLFAAFVTYALWYLMLGRARLFPLSPYLSASLCGALLVGLVSSLMDVPRVAFLIYILTLFSLPTLRETR